MWAFSHRISASYAYRLDISKQPLNDKRPGRFYLQVRHPVLDLGLLARRHFGCVAVALWGIVYAKFRRLL
jgi:hypothetical protein